MKCPEQLADPKANVRVDPNFMERLLDRAHIAEQHLQDSPVGQEPRGTNKFLVGESSDKDGNELASNDLMIGTSGSAAKTFNDHTVSIVSAILILTVVIQVILVKSCT